MATSGLINIGGGSSTPMTGATALLDGESGAAPTPLAGQQDFVLTGAGTYVESPTTQDLTWGMNYWSAFGTLSNAASTITTVATGSRSTLAPANQKLPMIGTTTPTSGLFTGSGVTRDTTNNRFQITVAGRYNVSADIFGGPSGVTQSALQLIFNGTTIIAMSASGNSEAYSPLNLGWEGDLSIGDTLELRVWTLGAGTYYHDGGTFIVSQQPTAVAPIVNTLAEYGVFAITNGVTRAGTAFGDFSTNQTFTLSSAGTFEIGYQLNYSMSGAASDMPTFQLVDVTNGNIAVAGTTSKGIRASNASGSSLRIATFVTISAATTYKLQAGVTTNTVTLRNTVNVGDSQGESHFFYNKIAGQLPATGQIVDYISLVGETGNDLGTAPNFSLTSDANLAITSVAPTTARLPFTTQTSGGTMTVTNSGNMTVGANAVTVLTTAVYSINASLLTSRGAANNYAIQLIKNGATILTTSNGISGSSVTRDTQSINWAGSLTQGDTVDIRVKDGGSFTVFVSRYSLLVNQLGSSLYTTLNAFTGANGTVAGTAGGVIAPAATDNTKFLKGDGTWSVGGEASIPNSPGSTTNAVAITDRATGGQIGSAATTVNIASAFNVTQTTAGQALTLPNPTAGTPARLVQVSNTGSTSFTMYSNVVPVGSSLTVMWNGVAWHTNPTFGSAATGAVLVSSGVGVMPVFQQKVVVIARNKTAQSIAANSWDVLTNWTEVVDNTNSFNGVTGTFTAPRSGNYSFSGGFAISVATGAYFGIAGYKAGTTAINNVLLSSGGANSTQYIGVSSIVELTAGQTLSLRGYNGNGIANSDVVSASNSWFTVNEL